MLVSPGLPDEEIRKKALDEPKVREIVAGKDIRKVFVVKGKLVNVVV